MRERISGLIKALIFDFDGLILDTESPEFVSFQEMFAEFGLEFPLSEWATNIGKGATETGPSAYEILQSRVRVPFDLESVRARRRARNTSLVLANEVLPGVCDYLLAAQKLGLKLGVASSSGSEWVEGHLKRLGLHGYFSAIRCADHVSKAKPDPELYLAVLDALKVDAKETVAFEDSPNGTKAARAAGIFTVVVPNPITRHSDLTEASMLLESMSEISLASLIEKIERTQNDR